MEKPEKPKVVKCDICGRFMSERTGFIGTRGFPWDLVEPVFECHKCIPPQRMSVTGVVIENPK